MIIHGHNGGKLDPCYPNCDYDEDTTTERPERKTTQAPKPCCTHKPITWRIRRTPLTTKPPTTTAPPDYSVYDQNGYDGNVKWHKPDYDDDKRIPTYSDYDSDCDWTKTILLLHRMIVKCQKHHKQAM